MIVTESQAKISIEKMDMQFYIITFKKCKQTESVIVTALEAAAVSRLLNISITNNNSPL